MFIDNRTKTEKLIENKKITDDVRKYFGISQIGNPCLRSLFYQFRFYLPPEELTPRQKRLFQRGHNEEPIIIKDLESIGIKLISTQNECSACHGHIKGHLDAILKNVPDDSKISFLGEFKTSKLKYFNSLVSSQSVKVTFPSHYDQAQGYMHLFKLKKCLYVCVCKDDDRRYYEVMEYDKEYCKSLMEKAESVIFATHEPERLGDSKYYRCGPKWCRYRNICHFNAYTEINHNCRNCKNVELYDKARWKCNKKKKFISFKKQQKGCKSWEILSR